MDDCEGNRQVEILADQDVFLDLAVWWRSPAQIGESSIAVFVQTGMMGEHGRAGRAAIG